MRHASWFSAVLGAVAVAGPRTAPAGPADPLTFVPAADVTLTDQFWLPRLETNRRVTIPAVFRMCERTGAIDNFDRAAGRLDGDAAGLHMNDEVVYKAVEAAAYELARRPDPDLDRYLDGVVAKIAAAQEPDGYLLTWKTVGLRRGDPNVGPRWSRMKDNELYMAGHLYDAAAAHFAATGKRELLAVAVKHADLVATIFGPDKRRDVCGHPNVEQALVTLSRATGDPKYFDLAEFFVRERGRANGRKLMGPFCQDHAPLEDQAEAVGQAPRATYLYAGATDVAAKTYDAKLATALDRLWADVVGRKMYVTGGVGSRHENEGFGPAYDLPNRTAYAETCAAVSFAMWTERMFRLRGDAEFIDVLEQTLFNNLLAGTSLAGDRFLYACPLESDGKYRFNRGWLSKAGAGLPFAEASAARKEWFACPCCPPNWSRCLPQIPGFVYATRGDELFVNLFAAGKAHVRVGGRRVELTQDTRYPWDGAVRLTVGPEAETEFTLAVRVPGWARGRPVPSDLYRFADDPPAAAVRLTVNGQAVPAEPTAGYARVTRRWKVGDVVELSLPMPVHRVVADDRVEACRGRVAIQRGPLVYCAEAADNGGRILELTLPAGAGLRSEWRPNLLGGVEVVTAPLAGRPLTAVPYFAWANRGPGEMAVWLRREP